jgi:hypothetical protein
MVHLLNSLSYTAFLLTHVWAVVLAFQVNGNTVWGWCSGILTLMTPFFSELMWGIWALKHGHPFFWGCVAFVVLLFIATAVRMFSASKSE